MKKRYLGIICFVYVFIILLTIIRGVLKNFLAPNMQVYLIASIIPFIIMGIALIKENDYEFKLFDLILLLPIIMIILSGDGRLTNSLSKNRVTNMKTEVKYEEESKEDTKEESTTEESESIITDDSEIYFDVKDASYYDLAEYLTFIKKAQKYAGKTIRVRGFVLLKESYIPKNYFMIGKYNITCCAADASYIGFFAKTKEKLKNNNWYEIEGKLEKGKDVDGFDTLVINVTSVKEIDGTKEEAYVYPCYSYDNGKCAEISKYNLEY